VEVLDTDHDIRMDLREMGGRVWIGCTWLRIGTSGSSCEQGSGSVKGVEFLNYVSDYTPRSELVHFPVLNS
jgi:hypothetical protein